MENTINQRITELISALKLNKQEFCTATNVGYTTLMNIVGGRGNKPSFEIIERIILTYDNVNPEWLLKGTGEMFKSEHNTQMSTRPESRMSQMSEEWRATLEKMEAFYQREIQLLHEQNMKLTDMLGKP